MPLAAYLKLDQNVLYNGNYSDSSSYRLSGTVYTDRKFTTAFDLTGYTLKIRIFRENSASDRYNKAGTINVAASGTFYRNVESGELPVANYYLVVLELSKSGSVITTINRVEILIKRGPQ